MFVSLESCCVRGEVTTCTSPLKLVKTTENFKLVSSTFKLVYISIVFKSVKTDRHNTVSTLELALMLTI